MSSLFQANLQGNSFHKNPLELTFGSRISLKNNGRGSGLLHSHIQQYPSGSEQQQVTCYHHKDSNNEWFVSWPWGYDKFNETTGEENIVKIKHGDVICLVHAQTYRNLHTHSVKAPLASSENEVSCYGNTITGDSNDHWKVEIVDNVAMWASNNALTPDPDNELDALTSTPIDWPLIRVGLRMCGWEDSAMKFWLIGHPITWHGSTACLLVVVFAFLVIAVRWQRNYPAILNDLENEWDNLWFAGKVGFIGWLLHYLPFWIMGRVM
ncbi:Protein O-mannosyltransferase 2 [Nowakowskiella sp. JEL0078]|nr:Protein O-mannosyltransferase 2 [Nowakowskiella sp. JEL0078]